MVIVVALLLGLVFCELVADALGVERFSLAFHLLACLAVFPACWFATANASTQRKIHPLLIQVWGTFLLHWVFQEVAVMGGWHTARTITSWISVILLGVAFVFATLIAGALERRTLDNQISLNKT